MLEKLKNRYVVFSIIMVLLFGILATQLGVLTLKKGETYAQESQAKTTRTISVKGSRGKILDANGIPLAVDEKSYDIVFSRDADKRSEKYRAMYTQVIMDTKEIVEKNGGRLINTLNIRKDENGEFVFYWGGELSEEAAARREERWRENMQINKSLTPEQVYMTLRSRYQVPESVPYEDASYILSVWQEVQLSSYMAYIPVKVAQNVDMNTVAEIETRSLELPGMDISESTVRSYPKGETAAHVVGYMGKMYDEDTISEMTKKGYSTDDLIGVAGVEATMEEQLTGNSTERQGKRIVEVNSQGKVIRELSSTASQCGNNVMLTIDLDLQQKLDQALKENIEEIKQYQKETYEKNKAEYDKELAQRPDTPLRYCEFGAAVVMDANSGKILALSSYPSYDPNVFTGGVSNEDYKQLSEDERAPLMNKAISSKAAPGSILKMATGMAALMEGKVTLGEKIDDAGRYFPDDHRSAACWVRPHFSRHSQLDMVKALKESCNYYFFTMADRLGINLLNKWLDQFGLTSKTNIELPYETVGNGGGQSNLYDNEKDLNSQKSSSPVLVRNSLKRLFVGYGEQFGNEYDDATLNRTAERIMKLVEKDQGLDGIGPDIRQIMREELGISETQSYSKGWDREVSSVLLDITWTKNQTILTGIGQSVMKVTPVAVARYVASLVNGGKVYEAHLVDKIIDQEGNVVEEKQPVVFAELNVNDEYIAAIREGMREVVSLEDGGTASKRFENYKYSDRIGGKTGTAQVSNVDLENTAWFVCVAPFDKNVPDIVVVVYIPYGASGANATETAKDIIEYYLDRNEQVTQENIPDANSLIN